MGGGWAQFDGGVYHSVALTGTLSLPEINKAGLSHTEPYDLVPVPLPPPILKDNTTLFATGLSKVLGVLSDPPTLR